MDQATLDAARNGNREAQAQLLRQLQDPWFRMCFSLLGNADAAQDATQETALRFLKSLRQFSGQSSLSTWSLGIAINVVREMRRKRKDVDKWSLLDRRASDASDDASLTEQKQALRAVLSELPERQREAVVLRFFEDLSVEETAQAMKCAVGTVKATVHQALRALRQKLTGASIALPNNHDPAS